MSVWQMVQAARDPRRPTSAFYISRCIDGFIELHGDRAFGDDAAIIGGVGWLGGMAVTVIGEEKGVDAREKVRRNFGSPHPEGYRKALRLMRQAEKFARPVICLVDTQGAFCGVGAEERGQGAAIAESLEAMMSLRVPILSVVIGEGGSGGALALAVADRVAMLKNANYGILTPEGFASILWKDASRAPEAAEVMRITAAELQNLGIIEDVIPEPGDNAASDPPAMAATLKTYLLEQVSALSARPTDDLLRERYERFRRMGA